jgi:hypothetical protein
MPGGAAPTCTAAMGMALATGDMCTNVGRCPGGNGGRTCVCDGMTVTCSGG